MLTGMRAVEEDEDEIEERPGKAAFRKRSKEIVASPWIDVLSNDNEAMVVDLYAKGMTTRDISNYMKARHGVEISQPSVSRITDKVYPLVKEWQSRSLSSCYPIVYLDGLHPVRYPFHCTLFSSVSIVSSLCIWANSRGDILSAV